MGAWQTQWNSWSPPKPGDATASWTDLLRQLPPIGLAREHNATLRELAAACAECQQLEQALREMLLGVQTAALDLLERRLRERQPTQVVAGFRELYDLWVECAEQVYAQVAHSEAYCRLQAQLGNAAIQVRARQQKLIEQALKQFDLPTRSELNSVHRQLREQAQQLRELKEQASGVQPTAVEERPIRSRRKGKSP
jgi:class III poly(R)-hydroxyalkanoic acid synthase PhaE subunit